MTLNQNVTNQINFGDTRMALWLLILGVTPAGVAHSGSRTARIVNRILSAILLCTY